MLIHKQTYTAAEFEALVNLPENVDRILELIEGEIIEKKPSNPYVSALAIRIAHFILLYLAQHDIGYVTGEAGGYRISDRNNFAPDVAFISRARQPQLPREGFNPIPPDLAVEVISPSDSYSDVSRKVQRYLRHGTALVWVVDPETQTVMVHTPTSAKPFGLEDTLDGGDVLPGFKLAVRDIF